MATAAPTAGQNGTRLTGRQGKAARLVAEDELTDAEIAARVKVGRSTLDRWKRRPAFAARVAEHREAFRARILAEVVAPCSLRSPHATWAEADPREWWDNLAQLVPQVLERAAARPADVVGIGASGALPALVLLDEHGEPLRPSIQQSDARAIDEIEYFKSRLDEDAILRRTGSGITQQSIGPKPAIPIYGIENAKLYGENLRAFQKVFSYKSKSLAFSDALQTQEPATAPMRW